MNIAIDKEALEMIAQQLESRMVDAGVLAADLKRLVASSKPATDPALVAEMSLEIRSFGHCRGAVHRPKREEGKPCDCRHCRILRTLERP